MPEEAVALCGAVVCIRSVFCWGFLWKTPPRSVDIICCEDGFCLFVLAVVVPGMAFTISAGAVLPSLWGKLLAAEVEL